jgi:uncharacterized protein YqiB (DUF1249 family)
VTMLDDDRLATLLARAGAAFEAPASGPADIVARSAGVPAPAPAEARPDAAEDGEGGDATEGGDAGEGGDATEGGPRLTSAVRRHRVLSVAACVVVALVVAGTVGALVRSPAPPNAPSTPGLPKTARGPGATTTVPTPPPGGVEAGPAFGASAAGSNQGAASAPSVTPPSTPTAPSLPSGAVGQSSKIEQTGTLGLIVRHGLVGRTVTRLAALAGAYGGFVANSQTQSGAGGAPGGTITLQVPVDDFSNVLKQAQTLGKTSALSTRATDVTGQYVDLQSRLTALEASRQQYLTIMSEATTVTDVLAVQAQLDTVQTQIEQLQGQLNVLTGETSYSTLAVTVRQDAPAPSPSPLPESGLVRAWHDGVGGFVAGVEGVVALAGPLLFALVCLAVALVGGRALWRRYQRCKL